MARVKTVNTESTWEKVTLKGIKDVAKLKGLIKKGWDISLKAKKRGDDDSTAVAVDDMDTIQSIWKQFEGYDVDFLVNIRSGK